MKFDKSSIKDYRLGFLFCSNPLDRRSSDFDYQLEFDVVSKYQYRTYLFNFDDLVSHGQVPRLPKNDCVTLLIYRGWILNPQTYETLYYGLLKQNYILINDCTQYDECHLFPNWYNKIEEFTPYSEYSNNIDDNHIIDMLKHFGNSSIIVKDYVKSRKHEWLEACYIDNASNFNDALSIIHTFLERQGENLTGGIVLRKYIGLISTGYHEKSGIKLSVEYRVFYLLHEILCVIDYWGNITDDTNLNHDEFNFIKSFSNTFDSNFFTIDFARKLDGSLIIIEVGDGQVSGLQNFNEKLYYSNFIDILG
ncbi:MAG: ATP-grasp domain-containing protein [Oscillospiraceae bacterium]